MRESGTIGKIAAATALLVAVVVLALILLGGGGDYKVRAVFSNASQIVTGDLVQVAGNPIGTVSDISLTPNGDAQLTLSINNGNYTPLRTGTIATVRQASLSGIANRYVDLRLGGANGAEIPDGGQIPVQRTASAVDFDELFNTLDAPTRKALQDVIQGSASQYQGYGKAAQLAFQYLNPAIASSSLLFQELNRDTSKLTGFLTHSATLVTDLAQRQSDLSGLIQNLSTTFSALANQHVALGSAINQLPGFLRQANTTFINLRTALTQLTPLVNVSKPVAPKLLALLNELRPFAQDAVPTVRDLSRIISRPGANNDLIELTKLGVPLAAATVDSVNVHGAVRPGAFPESITSLKGSTPELAFARPYAVDLTGWFEGFSHPGGLDANGGVSRIAPVVGVGSLQTGSLDFCSAPVLSLIPNCNALGVNNLLTNASNRLQFATSSLSLNNGDRCPGSMERGGTYYPETGYQCDPNQGPTGS